MHAAHDVRRALLQVRQVVVQLGGQRMRPVLHTILEIVHRFLHGVRRMV